MVKRAQVKSRYNAPVIERLFRLRENQTTIRTEVVAGLTTFLAMAYIIFVQPTVLGAAGMDFGAVLVATCLASALATVLMGVMANYPIAVAPAMGHNFYFAFAVVVGMKVPWPIALGGVFIAGAAFVLTAGFGLREKLITAIPDSLKHAIAAGIGLLIALIGLEWAGFVIGAPGTLVALGPFKGAAGSARALRPRRHGGAARAQGQRRAAARHGGDDGRRSRHRRPAVPGRLLGAAVAGADVLEARRPRRAAARRWRRSSRSSSSWRCSIRSGRSLASPGRPG